MSGNVCITKPSSDFSVWGIKQHAHFWMDDLCFVSTFFPSEITYIPVPYNLFTERPEKLASVCQ